MNVTISFPNGSVVLFPTYDAHVKAYRRAQRDEAERRAEYDREKCMD